MLLRFPQSPSKINGQIGDVVVPIIAYLRTEDGFRRK